MRPLALRRQSGFLFGNEWRELRDPDGSPSGRQLQRLNHSGMLIVVEPGDAKPLTKGECAYAIDVLEQGRR